MHEQSAFALFMQIVVAPDNIPIVGMMFLIAFFTYIGFKEARKNDDLIAQGREDEILRKMQE